MARFSHRLTRGTNSRTFSAKLRKKLKPGRYELIAIATDSAGQKSKILRVKFRVDR